MTAPRAATAACSRQPRAGYGDVGAAASTPIVAPGRFERAGVRRRVDAEREPGDDRHAGRGQPATERARDLQPVRGRPARADDRDRVLVAAARRRRRGRAAPPAGRRGRAAAPGRRRGSGRPSRACAADARSRARRRVERRVAPRDLARAPSSSSSSSVSASTRPGAVRCLNSTCSRPAIAAIRSVRRRQSSQRVMPPPRAVGVVEAQARGDVDVLGADDVGAVEVGDRARDAEDARVAAGDSAWRS